MAVSPVNRTFNGRPLLESVAQTEVDCQIKPEQNSDLAIRDDAGCRSNVRVTQTGCTAKKHVFVDTCDCRDDVSGVGVSLSAYGIGQSSLTIIPSHNPICARRIGPRDAIVTGGLDKVSKPSKQAATQGCRRSQFGQADLEGAAQGRHYKPSASRKCIDEVGRPLGCLSASR